MTANEIAELERLYEAGTRGEWVVDGRTHVYCDDRQIIVANTHVGQTSPYPSTSEMEANAALIAALHNALPELLAMAEWCAGNCLACSNMQELEETESGIGCMLPYPESAQCQYSNERKSWSPAWAKGE